MIPWNLWLPAHGCPGISSLWPFDRGVYIPAGHCLKPWRRQSFLFRIFPTALGTKSTGRGRAGLWGCTRVYGARVKKLSAQKHALEPPVEERL